MMWKVEEGRDRQRRGRRRRRRSHLSRKTINFINSVHSIIPQLCKRLTLFSDFFPKLRPFRAWREEGRRACWAHSQLSDFARESLCNKIHLFHSEKCLIKIPLHRRGTFLLYAKSHDNERRRLRRERRVGWTWLLSTTRGGGGSGDGELMVSVTGTEQGTSRRLQGEFQWYWGSCTIGHWNKMLR